jgi:hypothetical protein
VPPACCRQANIELYAKISIFWIIINQFIVINEHFYYINPKQLEI